MEQQERPPYHFRTLNGESYSEFERMDNWAQSCELPKPEMLMAAPPTITDLPLIDFPLIEDFEIVVEELVESNFGFHVFFRSQKRGFLSGFAWWDHAEKEMAQPGFQIPLGTVTQPFYDCEQGWEIIIFQHEDCVFVIEGTFEAENGYHSWYRVPTDDYVAAWRNAIALCVDWCGR